MHERLWKFLVLLAFIGGATISYGIATHQFFDVQNVVDSLLSGSSENRAQGDEEITQRSVSSTATTTTNAFVVKVIDGDTLIARYDGKEVEETVRLLGVNTPETVDPRRPVECFGKEASAYLHALLEGKRVRLEEDVRADNIDKYQRLLRNVVSAQGLDVNAALVKEGYAYSYLSFPLNPARKAELKKLENDARMAERGLWSKETCSGSK